MTKKHFEAIAEVIKNYHQAEKTGGEYNLSEAMADILQDFNSQFDRQRFLTACEVEEIQKCACDGCNNPAEQYYKRAKYCDGHFCMIHSTM